MSMTKKKGASEQNFQILPWPEETLDKGQTVQLHLP